MYLRKIECENVDGIHLSENLIQLWHCVNKVLNLRVAQNALLKQDCSLATGLVKTAQQGASQSALFMS
jgi:hypothetical protein